MGPRKESVSKDSIFVIQENFEMAPCKDQSPQMLQPDSNVASEYLLPLSPKVNCYFAPSELLARDETFEEIKQDTFSTGRLKALFYNLLPSLAATLSSSNIPFKCFSDIEKLYLGSVGLLADLYSSIGF
ncbi:hypothetical protein VNO78_25874 [Psophocarpus tetragonolobus]|uniref:Lipoxygenase domain-containing protein n=1 Tax=Psophocarpus tetragonolobus TaxID=3891 RepID=A0AAN9S6P2_PSOTE